MLRWLTPFLMVGLLSLDSASGGKRNNRQWETGKVLDSQRSQEFAGTVDRPGVVLTNGTRITNDSTRAVYRTQHTTVVEGETHTYTVIEILANPLGKVYASSFEEMKAASGFTPGAEPPSDRCGSLAAPECSSRSAPHSEATRRLPSI